MKTKNLFSILTLMVFTFFAIASTEEDESAFIKGICPADIYTGLEGIGFTTDKVYNNEAGHLWTSTSKLGGIDYRVEIYSTKATKVISARGTAILDYNKDINNSIPFLVYLTSLQYENSNPQLAEQWVKDNFNNDKATTTIGEVKFTILAPTQFVRVLSLEKAE